MKKYQFTILLVFLLFAVHQLGYSFSFPIGVSNTRYSKSSLFHRTYQNTSQKPSRYRSFSQQTGRSKSNARTTSSNVPVFISAQDFASHLNVGNQRFFQYMEPNENNTVSMDIGDVDYYGEAAQDWYLPDFSSFPAVSSTTINHIKLGTAYGNKDFPGSTHALSSPDGSTVEYYQLSDFDLYFMGYYEKIGTPKEASFDYNQTLSPVPLDFNFGLQTTVIIEFDDDPEQDSIKYEQFYDVIGYGTLHTADDGSHEALKMIFTEETYVYKDGDLISSDVYYELVWYSKEGHHVRAGINDPWNSEGQQDLLYMEYQKLTTVVPLAPENLSASTQSAGSILLNWTDKSVNETSFEIIRSKSVSENQDGTFTTIDATFTAPANATSFTDNTANAGTTYYYKVRAKKE